MAESTSGWLDSSRTRNTFFLNSAVSFGGAVVGTSSIGHSCTGSLMNSGPWIHADSARTQLAGVPLVATSAMLSSVRTWCHWLGSLPVSTSATRLATNGRKFLGSPRIHQRAVVESDRYITFRILDSNARHVVVAGLTANWHAINSPLGMEIGFNGMRRVLAITRLQTTSPSVNVVRV